MPQAPVAPFSPFQNQSFNEIAGLQGFAQPYFNVGAGLLGGSAAPVTSQDVAQYYNPMAQNVTAQMQNIFGQQDVQNTGSLQQQAGGVGADRIAVGQANLANQQGLAAGQTYAGLYQSALQAAQQQKQMMAGAGYGIGQMGPAALAAQQNEVNQLLGAGGMQQQLAQAQANAAYQQQLAQVAFPYQQPQYLAGITAGLAPAMGGTTYGQAQTTYPAPSALAQGLGVGTSLLGLGGMMGGGGGKGSGIVPGMYSMGTPGGGYGTMGGMGGSLGGFYRHGGAAMADGGDPNSNYGMLDQKARLHELGNLVPAEAAGNPIASEIVQDVGGTGYDDGGRIQLAGDVLTLDPYLTDPNMTLRQALERSKNRTSPGAQGFAGAPEEAVQRAQDQGVLKIHPAHGFDDGGTVDQPMPQSPMGAAPVGYKTPGADPHVGVGNVIPQSQLPQGQGGHSMLPYGQGMYMPPPSMSGKPQTQSGLGGMNLGQLGQMAGSLGNLFGGGSAAAGAAGDAAAGAGDATAALDLLALANRGGRMARGGEAPDTPQDTRSGYQADLARKWQGFESRFPKDAPPEEWIQPPGVIGNRGATAAGGAVNPMSAGQGFGEDDDAFTADPNTNQPTPEPHPFMDTLSKAYHYVTDPPPPKSAGIVPPEAQSQYASEGHPNLQDPDRPFIPSEISDDEARGYGEAKPEFRRTGTPDTLAQRGYAPIRFPMGQQSNAPTNVATPELLPQPPQVAAQKPIKYDGLNSPAQAETQYAQSVPMSPYGHPQQPMGADSAPPLAAAGVPQGPGTVSFRGQEYDLGRLQQATKRWESGGNYQNDTVTRNSRGQIQHALGAYGIMDFNLGMGLDGRYHKEDDWSLEALGRHVSPQELLANPKLQDAIYNYKMGQYVQRYGLEGAGRAWLGGEGSLNAPGARDPLGTSVGTYGRKFVQYYNEAQPGGGGTAQGVMTAGMRPSDNVEDVRNNVGMRTASPQGTSPMGTPMQMPPGQTPYPDALQRDWGQRAARSPWMALVRAGAAMAGSTGPIGTVLAHGISAGAGELDAQRTALRSEEGVNQRAEQLYQQAQQHLETARYHEQEISDRTRRTDIMAERLKQNPDLEKEVKRLQALPENEGRTQEEILERAEENIRQRRQFNPNTPTSRAKPPGTPDNYVYGKNQQGQFGWAAPGTEGFTPG